MKSDTEIATFLMFTGNAEEAMNSYVALFDNSVIQSVTRYGPDEGGQQGSVKHAQFSLNGQAFICIDSPVKHEFDFTPAISISVTSPDAADIARYFGVLARDGSILMPLDTYPFSPLFGWVQDRFGISWQLNCSASSGAKEPS